MHFAEDHCERFLFRDPPSSPCGEKELLFKVSGVLGGQTTI